MNAIQRTWLDQARSEYSAAAHTAQLCHWLVVLGLSPDTLERSAAVVGDEVRHSALSYGVFQHAGGRTTVAIEAPHLWQNDDPDAELPWRTVSAVAALVVEETLSVPVFRLRLHNATDPVARRACETILRDEGRHRAFAWDVLDELTERLGAAPVQAWVRARIAWWLRPYLVGRAPSNPVFSADELAFGLIDPAEHLALLRATIGKTFAPRLRKRGMLEAGIDLPALRRELVLDGAVPPWQRGPP